MKNEYLFVYGTLMGRFEGNPLRSELDQYAVLIDQATTPGKLFKIEDYPGFVPEGNELVHGEIWEVSSVSPLWDQLDAYEGVNAAQPEKGEYRRSLFKVHAQSKGQFTCWVYVYQGPLEGKEWIESGRFA